MSLLLSLLLGLCLGLALGLVHFAGLARTSGLLLDGRAGRFLLWQMLRLGITLGLLLLIARTIDTSAALAAVGGLSLARLLLVRPQRALPQRRIWS